MVSRPRKPDEAARFGDPGAPLDTPLRTFQTVSNWSSRKLSRRQLRLRCELYATAVASISTKSSGKAKLATPSSVLAG